MAETFKITGAHEILDKLGKIAPTLQKKYLRSAVRKGANIIRKSAQDRAKRIDDPATAESISKNISVQFASRESKRAGGVVFRVGVRGGAKQYGTTKENTRAGRSRKSYATPGSKGNPGGDTWYWRFVELGTSKMRAQPFMQPALSENVEAVTSTVTGELNKALDEIVK